MEENFIGQMPAPVPAKREERTCLVGTCAVLTDTHFLAGLGSVTRPLNSLRGSIRLTLTLSGFKSQEVKA